MQSISYFINASTKYQQNKSNKAKHETKRYFLNILAHILTVFQKKIYKINDKHIISIHKKQCQKDIYAHTHILIRHRQHTLIKMSLFTPIHSLMSH